jgi:hypothetical protein
MIAKCFDMERQLDAVVNDLEAGIMPEMFAHCVNCDSANIEYGDDDASVFCLDCKAIESSVDWVADSEIPAPLANLWADAPVIPPAYIITTKVYQFGQEEAA